INKYKKPSQFLDDFLMNPKIQKFDTAQSSPKVVMPAGEAVAGAAPDSTAGGGGQLFAGGVNEGETRAYSQVALWAKSYYPPIAEPLQLSASAIERYLKCPMQYLFESVWGIRGGPSAAMTFGNAMH